MKFKTTLIFTSLIFLSITTHAQSIEEQQVNKTMQDQMNLFQHDFRDYLKAKDSKSSEDLLLTKLCKVERDAVKLVYMSFNLSYSENKDNIIKLAMKQRDSVRNVFVADFDTTHEKACKMSKAQFYTLMDKHLTTSTALVSDFSNVVPLIRPLNSVL